MNAHPIYEGDIRLELSGGYAEALTEALLRSASLLDRKADSLRDKHKFRHAEDVSEEADHLLLIGNVLGSNENPPALTYAAARIVRRALSVTVDKLESQIERKMAETAIVPEADCDRLDLLEDVLDQIVGQMLDARSAHTEEVLA